MVGNQQLGYGNTMASFNQGTGANIANLATGMGTAQAQGITGQAQAQAAGDVGGVAHGLGPLAGLGLAGSRVEREEPRRVGHGCFDVATVVADHEGVAVEDLDVGGHDCLLA